jgi:hypothetical protein
MNAVDYTFSDTFNEMHCLFSTNRREPYPWKLTGKQALFIGSGMSMAQEDICAHETPSIIGQHARCLG